MKERLIGCLEKGGQRLRRTAPIPTLRSRRLLHSTFWSHGAGNIDLPSWWLSLLQLPQAHQEDHGGSASLGPNFLDFLYPSQTLAFIRKHASTDLAVLKRYQRVRKVHQRSRGYTSIVVDNDNEVSETSALEARASEQGKQIQVLDQKVNSTNLSRVKELRSSLDQLLLQDDRRTNHLQLWRIYLELQEFSVELSPRQILRMMHCLSRTPFSIDQERLLELFESVPIGQRRLIHYSYAVPAALKLERLLFAVEAHKEALSRTARAAGTSALMHYTIDRGLWQIAIEIWQAVSRDKLEELGLWQGIDPHRIPDTWTQALSALAFASELQYLGGISSNAANAALGFAKNLCLASLALPTKDVKPPAGRELISVRHISPEVGEMSLEVQNKDFFHRLLHYSLRLHYLVEKAIALHFSANTVYASAIRQALLFEAPAFDKLALQYYQALRDLPEPTVSSDIILGMLRRLRSINSTAGMLMALNDYRFFCGDLPVKTLYDLVRAFAWQGERKAVEDLLEEIRTRRLNTNRSDIANAVLTACNRRGETHDIMKIFQNLEHDYGFKPDLKSWNIVIATCSRVGNIEAASKWFNDMLETGIRPDSWTYISLMSMFARRGDLDAVKQLLRESVEQDVPTDIRMIDCLVLAHCHNEQLEDAEELVEQALDTVEDVPNRARTRMWNTLLTAYAFRYNPKKVIALHKRMRESGIPSDGATYSALMLSLLVNGRVIAAKHILMRIMPQAGVQPTATHYAIAMKGYLKKGAPHKALELYSSMLEHAKMPNLGAPNALIKAAALIDRFKAEQERQTLNSSTEESSAAAHETNFNRAQQALDQALDEFDPIIFASKEPIQELRSQRLDIAGLASHFSYLVALYGRHRLFDKVQDLYRRYLEKREELKMDFETSPPIEMLGALMSAHEKAQDYQAIDQSWRYSLEQATALAKRRDADVSQPNWVLRDRRFLINKHLRYYVRSLQFRKRFDEIDSTISYLHWCGFELDSRSWNQYVSVLACSERLERALEVCEKELMPGWGGWKNVTYHGTSNSLRHKFKKHVKLSQRLLPHGRYPAYRTIVFLAGALVEAQNREIPADQYGRTLMDRLKKLAPRTVQAVVDLPYFDDPLQSDVLRKRPSYEQEAYMEL